MEPPAEFHAIKQTSKSRGKPHDNAKVWRHFRSIFLLAVGYAVGSLHQTISVGLVPQNTVDKSSGDTDCAPSTVATQSATSIPVEKKAIQASNIVDDNIGQGDVYSRQKNISSTVVTQSATSIPVAEAGIHPSNIVDDNMGLRDVYRHPKDAPHCYKKGNDWSACAGDHLMYPKASKMDLLKRKYMCLHEPLCWRQLDWESMNPPQVQCQLSRDMSFMDWAFHDGTMASLPGQIKVTMAQKVGPARKLNMTLCNIKASRSAMRNYHHTFHNCQDDKGRAIPPLLKNWATAFSEELASDYFQWFRNDPQAPHIDSHITSFPPPLFEFLMSFNRSIIVNALHRVNMFRCTHEESKAAFDNLIRLASSGPTGKYGNGANHIIGPGHIHEVEYIRHYTGIRPIYLPFSLLAVMEPALEGREYTGENATFILNAKRIPEKLPQLNSNHSTIIPTRYELWDLLKYRASIILPYSIVNTKTVEQYEMNIPIFTPTPTFALELNQYWDRTATYKPYCANLTNRDHPSAHTSSPYEFSPNARHNLPGDEGEDELFWIKFSELYLWPCIEYFSSWAELNEKLDTYTLENYMNISSCMKKANEWRRFEAESNLCWALNDVGKTSGSRSVAGSDYKSSMNALFSSQ